MDEKEITPEESVVPIFLNEEPQEPLEGPVWVVDEKAEARASAVAKLAPLADFTPEEIEALVT